MASSEDGLALDAAQDKMSEPFKVLFSCTGVGILNRGIESFFRESFDGLKDAMPRVEVRLLKGSGESREREMRVPCLPRTGLPAKFFGRMLRRNAYVAEQLSSFPFIVKEIRRWRPDVVFYSDSNLGFQLFRWRKQIRVPFKLLFSNGGPCRPPFNRTDFVHQVAPLYREEALAVGEQPTKHFLVPYGITVPQEPVINLPHKLALRSRLGIPSDKFVVLSVGWIARQHKRMHYVIEEVAKMPEPRPFLQLLGAMDEASPEIIEMGLRLLGPTHFSARSVPYAEVANYYQAADCFVLASLKEGFGRVYLEALMHGLPVIAHRHPVMEYVLANQGILSDLTEPGKLSQLLSEVLTSDSEISSDKMRMRWQSVRDRFSWPTLAGHYEKMFTQCAAQTLTS